MTATALDALSDAEVDALASRLRARQMQAFVQPPTPPAPEADWQRAWREADEAKLQARREEHEAREREREEAERAAAEQAQADREAGRPAREAAQRELDEITPQLEAAHELIERATDLRRKAAA